MTIRTKILATTTAAVLAATAGAARADITGNIDATITLESGCIINGDNNSDGASNVDFGTLDFGTQTTLFTQADADVVGNASGISIQCTAGNAPVLTFGAGENDGEGTGGGNKAMVHATDSAQFVSYTLFADSGRSDAINVGRQFTLANDGSQQTVNVYGRAFGEAGLIEGTYTDIVSVTLEL